VKVVASWFRALEPTDAEYLRIKELESRTIELGSIEKRHKMVIASEKRLLSGDLTGIRCWCHAVKPLPRHPLSRKALTPVLEHLEYNQNDSRF
jgi:hypothetical protein